MGGVRVDKKQARKSKKLKSVIIMNLETYLVKNNFNKENFDKLIEIFNKEEFIPFVGAGSSVPMGGPDWLDLLKKMQNSAGIEIRPKKDSIGNINFPKYFSRLFKKMKDQSSFYSQLFKSVEPTETGSTEFHVHLVSTFYAYITTNYDTPIERAYKKEKRQEIKKHFFSCYKLDNLKDSVVYLHGHKDIGFAIIKEEDYRYFYPSVNETSSAGIPILESFLEQVYVGKKIIFIGFSFNDQYVAEFIKLLGLKYKDKRDIIHFLLIKNNATSYLKYQEMAGKYRQEGQLGMANEAESKFFQNFMSINIYPIVYTENIFVERLLEKLKRSEVHTTIDKPQLNLLNITGS